MADPVTVRDGQVKSLQPMRCHACRRLLMRIDPDALRPGKIIEAKCRCDVMNYRIGQMTTNDNTVTT